MNVTVWLRTIACDVSRPGRHGGMTPRPPNGGAGGCFPHNLASPTGTRKCLGRGRAAFGGWGSDSWLLFAPIPSHANANGAGTEQERRRGFGDGDGATGRVISSTRVPMLVFVVLAYRCCMEGHHAQGREKGRRT
jgi:hypothetical protein